VMIIARINGTPGFGFAEALTQRDGSVKRMGRLELRLANGAELQSIVARREPLVYSGPVWVGDRWVNESFPVTLTPVALIGDVLASVSIVQCNVAAMTDISADQSDSHVAA
jgi:hypothetical protein